ncbi:hypothetical protein [Pseudomonas sp. PDM09]|jgi:hypothetical protein|uniref:hypothetical protein n=1 Tax=Pseudomonas TaxID=286 RepID=UPI001786FCCD|nr:hypothetical protein [Pseudomonas sp. PDM09]MBD9564822.1 hypothetical protein [Pseudomonas sp. PDM09]
MNSHGFLAILNKSDFDRKLKAKGAGVKRSEKGTSEKGTDLFLCFVKGGHAYLSGLVTATELDK